jgi:hypothetical protein
VVVKKTWKNRYMRVGGLLDENVRHLCGWLKVDWDEDMIGDDSRGRWRGGAWEGTMASVFCSEDEGNDWES